MPYYIDKQGQVKCYNDIPPSGATPCTQMEAKRQHELNKERKARVEKWLKDIAA